jgi:hypothetical protein
MNNGKGNGRSFFTANNLGDFFNRHLLPNFQAIYGKQNISFKNTGFLSGIAGNWREDHFPSLIPNEGGPNATEVSPQ